MTDEELVKRLRDEHLAMTRNEAAAAIEALTAKNEMLGREVNIARYGQPDFAWSVHVQVMDDLNAKLAKAVEALRAFKDFDDMPTSYKRPDVFELRVRRKLLAALAEIEGEKR
jgi:hypothetical protein